MTITKKELLKNYFIYDKELQAYVKNKKLKKEYELELIIKIITGKTIKEAIEERSLKTEPRKYKDVGDTSGVCVCSKIGLRYLYYIKDADDNSYIVGSVCINKFLNIKDVKIIENNEKIMKGLAKGKKLCNVCNNNLINGKTKKCSTLNCGVNELLENYITKNKWWTLYVKIKQRFEEGKEIQQKDIRHLKKYQT